MLSEKQRAKIQCELGFACIVLTSASDRGCHCGRVGSGLSLARLCPPFIIVRGSIPSLGEYFFQQLFQ